MKMTIDIPEKDLIEFGRESIYQEMNNTLRWMKLKTSFRRISEALKTTDEKEYYNEMEEIRNAAWEEYRKDLS